MGRKAASICVCVCNLCLCVMIAPLKCLQFNLVEPSSRNSFLFARRAISKAVIIIIILLFYVMCLANKNTALVSVLLCYFFVYKIRTFFDNMDHATVWAVWAIALTPLFAQKHLISVQV